MDRDFQTENWRRYLRSCHSLGYTPDATADHRLLNRYEMLYNRYCIDNGIQLDLSRGFDEQVNIEKLSQALYINLCKILGFHSIINIRRTIWELKTNIMNNVNSEENVSLYELGSKAEGFRLPTSDFDHMFAFSDQIILYTEDDVADIVISYQVKDVLVAEMSQPGYVRLRLITEIAKNPRIAFSRCALEGKFYVSSAKFREYHILLSSSFEENAYVHGPCITTIHSHIESDVAHCLECTTHPKVVQDWMERCKKYAWPSSDVLKDCELTKCQLAPVGAKGSPEENLEWRISFILFEKKLVLSLNHCQFMCYGMLKLFLRDVLNNNADIKDLLSSYVMKTVIFWEIQTNRDQSWEVSTLLENFLLCLQRLCRYVESENCPNFFIPENNIFQNKVFGVKRRILQGIIESLSQEKFHGLYKCNSIDLPYIIFDVMISNTLIFFMDERFFVTQDDLDDQIWKESTIGGWCYLFRQNSINYLNKLHHAIKCQQKQDGLSDLEHQVLEAWKSETTITMTSHQFKEVTSPNTKSVSLYNSCCDTLRKHDHEGSVALFYLATLMYVAGRYSSCLEVIRESNKRLKEGYLEIITVSNHLQLSELMLELESTTTRRSFNIETSRLGIDASVYASFLSVLARHRLGDEQGAAIEFQLFREILSDMPKVRYSQEMPKVKYSQEMSYQLLGICAEILEKYGEAFSSYMKAAKSPKYLIPNGAPLLRMICLIFKLLRKSETDSKG